LRPADIFFPDVARPNAKCKCVHCKKLFLPDYRNRGRQRFCREPACRRESQRESQRLWLSQLGNADYFRGSENTARVQAWRRQRPGYARRPTQTGQALQETCSRQITTPEEHKSTHPVSPLQDLCSSQEHLLVGLVATFIDSPLQEYIAGHLHHLIAKGREILGHHAPPVPPSL